MHIGSFHVHETIKCCPEGNCKKIHRNTHLDDLVQLGSRFGYDIIECIGESVWRKSRTVQQIKAKLEKYNILISEREIGHLARKYVYYVLEAHKDKQEEIRQFLQRGGGYFLYFDSMHPGDGASHMMCAVAEEISERVSIVLGSVKLPKESTETVATFLRDLKKKYGDPLAGVCDMLASNLSAFKEVFPSTLLLICHFHFLRGVGKKFLEKDKDLLDGFLEQYGVKSRLKEIAGKCKTIIDSDIELAKFLRCDKNACQSIRQLPEIVKAYSMIMWILSYKQELNGYGFPFDRANLAYFQRMRKIYNSLKNAFYDCEKLSELNFFLGSVLTDPKFQKTIATMEKKVSDFDRLRDIMKIAPEYGGKGLNDDGEECDMTVMENQLKIFIESDEIKNNPDDSYKKMIRQIKKNWEMLFAEPVAALQPNGETISIYPQRTSNCMERLFREFQHLEYKRTGMNTLGRTVRAMVAETPMMKNLQCPEYMEIILNGQPSLAKRFSELDKKKALAEMRKSRDQRSIPPGIKKIMKIPEFYKKLMGIPGEALNIA